MNLKTRSLLVLIVISTFLLSSCEVYRTLYGTGPEKPEGKVEEGRAESTQVIRVEGDQAKDPTILSKTVYATANPTEHDPFKVGDKPLGPFEKGKSLGFSLGQWLAATGNGTYSVDGDKARFRLSFTSLVPNGVYTLWCSRITFPPNPKIVDRPCGDEDGSENSFKADNTGSASFRLRLNPLEQSTEETATIIALAYHSDNKTYGASPGDFGLNSHVQIFFLMPVPLSNKTPSSFKVDMQFVNHIQAGLPEQDVFIESMEEVVVPTGEAVVEEEYKEKSEEEVVPKEEVREEKLKEKPIVLIAQETDLISLVPKAEDPDRNTSLVFTFTSPLNENGEWQTAYGDGGEYTVTITASDGELTTTKEVLIIVNKKEEPPAIESTKPIESGLTIEETQAIEFSIVASDLNNDPLKYTWKLDGIDAGNENTYTYQTDYESGGTHTVKVDVSDSISSTSKIWSVNVENVNREPILEKINDIYAKETDNIVITALATDDDKDTITYSISDKIFKQEDNAFTWQTDYDSAGTYQVTVSASDGQDTVEQTFTVTVENVNRPPVIVDIVQKK